MPRRARAKVKPVRKAKSVADHASRDGHPHAHAHPPGWNHTKELVVITGLSGSGKVSALKVFEDLGYYCVDNLPVDLMLNFVELSRQSGEIERTAVVVDVREGRGLERLPRVLREVQQLLKTTIVFLEADDDALVRRFSETRRPHPLGMDEPVKTSIGEERKHLKPIRAMADVVIDTTKFNVHELRAFLKRRFSHEPAGDAKSMLVSFVSFGFKHGVPDEADLLFDVRFLPNPHFIPEYRPYTGRHPKVAKYIRSFPQTQEFIRRISELLVYLIPHYVEEGKSYLTIGFGCTGGQHRSVLIAHDVAKELDKAGYPVKVVDRDSPK
jgi:UPF0042 nucleotide-binding protein